jgi:hypothetical protein
MRWTDCGAHLLEEKTHERPSATLRIPPSRRFDVSRFVLKPELIRY